MAEAVFQPQSVDQERRLQRIRGLATLLDSQFQIPGTNIRFGLDGLIGLLPVGGDVLSAALSGYLIVEAAKFGIPRHVVARMIGNLALDTAVGAIPFLGDIFDVAFKANRRNVKLLNRHLEKLGQSR